jgi:hypothetical protein
MGATAQTKGTNVAKLKRLARVAGTVAAASICLSFAWNVVGGALRFEQVPPPAAVVIVSASHPVPLPPLVPPRPARPPRMSGKLAAFEVRTSTTPTGTAETAAGAATSQLSSLLAAASESLSEPAAVILHAESKSSRTRGQPEQE